VAALVAFAFFAVIAWLLFRAFQFRGLRGAMFGARIQATVGEVAGGGSVVNTVLKVHVLDNPPDKAVGIELVAKSLASYQVMPITLSVTEANTLVGLLQSATRGA
jgi:hypothetical protein